MSDTIYSLPGRPFDVRVQGFPTGLAGTVGYRILNDTGTAVTARTINGISESPDGSGSYIASPTAPALDGTYSVMWDTGVVSPSTTAYDTLVVDATGGPPAPPGSYTPTIDEVAAVVPSRAKGQYGRIATFDDTTQPTGSQVQSLIDTSAGKLAGKFGTPPSALMAGAREVVKLRAAMLVELTFFGDQIRADRSPYGELKALYEEAVTDFLADRAALGGDEIPGTADDQQPLFSFPDPDQEWFARASGAEQADDFNPGPVW